MSEIKTTTTTATAAATTTTTTITTTTTYNGMYDVFCMGMGAENAIIEILFARNSSIA